MQVLREPQGETARKQTLAFPKFNMYSGTEAPGKGEVTFKAWRYEVKSLCASHEGISSERSNDQIIEGTCCDGIERFTHKCNSIRDPKANGTEM